MHPVAQASMTTMRMSLMKVAYSVSNTFNSSQLHKPQQSGQLNSKVQHLVPNLQPATSLEQALNKILPLWVWALNLLSMEPKLQQSRQLEALSMELHLEVALSSGPPLQLVDLLLLAELELNRKAQLVASHLDKHPLLELWVVPRQPVDCLELLRPQLQMIPTIFLSISLR